MSRHSINHTLVIGGTGMLSKALYWLAGESHTLSLIARNQSRLKNMQERLGPICPHMTLLSVDYHETSLLEERVHDTLLQRGPADLVLSWIHSSAPDARHAIASQVQQAFAGKVGNCHWFDLLGSSVADPSIDATDGQQQFEQWTSIVYHSITLGFILESEGSRWLTHTEICDGVIDAIQHGSSDSVVGTLHPWSARP